jgi:arabinose-5-phosphate isomerase
MQEVLVVMTGKSFGCAAVCDDRVILRGIITDGDLRRHMGESLLAKTAQEVMTENPVTVTPNMLATEALAIMNDKAITSLFALGEDKKPLGVLHIHDCLRAGVA